MVIDNLLNSINRRLRQIASTFGKGSYEYKEAMASITAALNQFGELPEPIIENRKGKSARFKRSKSVFGTIKDVGGLEEVLQDVWETMKARGTVKQMIKERYNDIVEEEKGDTSKAITKIRKASRQRAEDAFSDDDYYVSYQKLLESAEGEELDEVEALGSIFDETPGKGNYGEMQDKFDRFVSALDRIERNNNARLRGEAVRKEDTVMANEALRHLSLIHI